LVVKNWGWMWIDVREEDKCVDLYIYRQYIAYIKYYCHAWRYVMKVDASASR
jgi:hypothetical protein